MTGLKKLPGLASPPESACTLLQAKSVARPAQGCTGTAQPLRLLQLPASQHWLDRPLLNHLPCVLSPSWPPRSAQPAWGHAKFSFRLQNIGLGKSQLPCVGQKTRAAQKIGCMPELADHKYRHALLQTKLSRCSLALQTSAAIPSDAASSRKTTCATTIAWQVL